MSRSFNNNLPPSRRSKKKRFYKSYNRYFTLCYPSIINNNKICTEIIKYDSSLISPKNNNLITYTKDKNSNNEKDCINNAMNQLVIDTGDVTRDLIRKKLMDNLLVP